MKSFLKHFTFFLLTAVTVCFFTACDDLFSHVSNSSGTGVYGDFHYSYGPSTVTITLYTGSGGNVVIPAVIDGKPVTAIKIKATEAYGMMGVFSEKQLTGITIPNSVIYIGNYEFRGNQLTSVTIPDSVTSIGNDAFYDNKLTSVTIGSNVTSIGSMAFYDNQLTSVTIPNSVTSIGFWAFRGNKLTSVTIGSGVTSIDKMAFYDNPLTNVTVDSGNTAYISKNSFLMSKDEKQIFLYYGSGKNITIPNSVTYIEYGAFFDDNQLTSITIGANVTLGITSGSAFANGFNPAYNNGGKQAGTYTRPDTDSMTWTKN